MGGCLVLLLINSFFSQKKEANKKWKKSEDGFMLLEVVIVIVITVMLMTALYQFFGFMNKKSRSQITDQVLSDSINNFFQAISKDFRTAKYVTFNNSNEIYIVNQLDQSITYTFLADSIEKNNIKIIQGITNSNIIYDPGNNRKISISLSTSNDDYTTSIVRRNPPSPDE